MNHTTTRATRQSQPFRWGTHFKNGKLYLFTQGSITVVKGWPELRAWRKTPARPQWKPVRPTLSFQNQTVAAGTPRRSSLRYESQPTDEAPAASVATVSEFADEPLEPPSTEDPLRDWHRKIQEREAAAFREFFSTFPPEIPARLKDFTSRQWHLAALAARCPGALDLLASNPALAYCLASNWVFHTPAVQQPLRAARALVRRRQRDLSGWLGFPATEAVVRVLRKIPPECCEISSLLYLRSALALPRVLQTLSHLPRVDSTILRIVGDPRLFPLTSFNLLVELSASSPSPSLISRQVKLLHDIVEIVGMLNQPVNSEPFRTLPHLRHRHDDLSTRIRQKVPAQLLSLKFPPPPIPGTATVVPITTPQMLLEEAAQQINCVVGYSKCVARGESYLYRVLSPERATLAVERTPNGWRLSEVALARNARPSLPTLLAAKAWMSGDGWKPEWGPF